MIMEKISVAILGTGPLASLLEQRIKSNTLLHFTGSSESVSTGSHCVIYLPTAVALADGTAGARISDLLRSGVNVVSTAPTEALQGIDLLAACREGKTSYHGTGGFQSSLVSRFNRAFAAITRNIRDVTLLEELDVEDAPAHPWANSSDAGLDAADSQTLNAQVAQIGGYYDAGLRLLSDAVFADSAKDTSATANAARQERTAVQNLRAKTEHDAEQICVCRNLGNKLSYDSVWTKRSGSTTPLRYRFTTRSADAVGHVSINFHAGNGVRPADHLTASGLLDAISAVVKSAPGILRHDLDIWHVKADDRFRR